MKRVGVIFGGRSAEHEVSISSAQAVLNNLDRDLFQPVLIYITRGGTWSVVEESFFTDQRAGASHSFIPWDNRFDRPLKLDILFPLLHGPNGEDGKIQGIFEMARVPFVGAASFPSALAMNKHLSKRLFMQAGLQTPKHLFFQSRDPDAIVQQIREALSLPVFVKPNNLGSSVGITKVSRPDQLADAIRTAFECDSSIVVEEGIECREIEICVMGNRELEVSPPGEVIPYNEFYDYEDKYKLGKTRFGIPARLDAVTVDRVKSQALTGFRSLFLNGWARVDFLIDRRDGEIYINEINTIPGFTSISMFPKLWGVVGISFGDLITRLIDLGFEYYAQTGG